VLLVNKAGNKSSILIDGMSGNPSMRVVDPLSAQAGVKDGIRIASVHAGRVELQPFAVAVLAWKTDDL
jgi:hypothetical protein